MNTVLIHRAIYWFIILGVLLFVFLLLQPKTSGHRLHWLSPQHFRIPAVDITRDASP
ncbi:hypothetical protein [Vampirovibrio chlorellavorus]|uniref:hypothetical protein n=1 Tax=Vampirovibrio chlorellavorus TaxID=758823 RepID=UPI0026E9EA1A|nr:hypothetical protein [Vampirovibrio chlorellavorus]